MSFIQFVLINGWRGTILLALFVGLCSWMGILAYAAEDPMAFLTPPPQPKKKPTSFLLVDSFLLFKLYRRVSFWSFDLCYQSRANFSGEDVNWNEGMNLWSCNNG